MAGTMPRSGKAYEIFVNEFHKHMGFIAEILAKPELTPDEMGILSRLFHTIKGGSGFFGFEVVHKNSGLLEKLFKNEDLNYATEKTEIASIFSELIEHSGEIRI